MSNADRVGLAYVEETVFGTTPSGPPTLQDLRFTNESLSQNTGTVSSAEIRPDRQVTDVIRTNIGGEGDVGMELSYGAFDEWFEFALQATAWSSPVTVGPNATTSFTAPDTIDDSGSGFGSIVANQWIKITGATNAVNNGYFKVATAAAGQLTVVEQTIATDSASAATTVVMGGQILNGTDDRFMTIEKVYSDLSAQLAVYTGMMVDTFALNVAVEQVLSGSFGFLGKAAASGTATVGDGSNTAAPTNSILNPVDHVVAILEGQASYGVQNFGFNLGNNLRSRLQVATLGAISVGSGKVNLTGTFQAYFNDAVVMNKYLGDTASSLSLVVQDTAGNAYVFDFPQVKYTSGTRVAGGENTDVMADMAFTAYRDAVENVTVRVARWAA